MFGTIIITVAITALSMFALFMLDRNRQSGKENKRLIDENTRLYNQITDFHDRERRRRESRAYNKGLYDGRETDTLYRRMLSKVSKNEQATVMMYGEEGGHRYE